MFVNVHVHLGFKKKEGKQGAPVTQRESDDNGTVFARCVTSPEGGTLVHCASGLIIWIKENIIKTFPHAHAIKQRERERVGGVSDSFDG